MFKKKDYNILIVDDEEGMRIGLKKALELEGYPVQTVENGKKAVNAINSGMFQLAYVDLRLPDIDAIEVMKQTENTLTNMIIITAYASVETAVNALKSGYVDYIKKPFNLNEIIQCTDRHYNKTSELFSETDKKPDNDSHYIFNSSIMKSIINKIELIKDCDIPVLITGESGTGKEVIARMIHDNSCRKTKPFIGINCVVIPPNLLESELFGHEKGAFTGALNQKLGKFEHAKDGTLLLDEIGEMELSMQVKLLRVLEEKTFERVGGIKPVPLKARIIACTNQNLEKYIIEKKFRNDLFYRLNGIKIVLPPLRERKEDIEPLIYFYLNHFIKMYSKNQKNISNSAMQQLLDNPWYGNIRELKNVIESAVLLSDTKTVLFPEDFLLQNLETTNTTEFIEDNNEKQKILKTLTKFQYNRSLTAKAMKVSRKTLYNKMKRYQLIND